MSWKIRHPKLSLRTALIAIAVTAVLLNAIPPLLRKYSISWNLAEHYRLSDPAYMPSSEEERSERFDRAYNHARRHLELKRSSWSLP